MGRPVKLNEIVGSKFAGSLADLLAQDDGDFITKTEANSYVRFYVKQYGLIITGTAADWLNIELVEDRVEGARREGGGWRVPRENLIARLDEELAGQVVEAPAERRDYGSWIDNACAVVATVFVILLIAWCCGGCLLFL